MKKIGIFSMHPAQYRDSVFRELIKIKKFDIRIYSYYHIPGTHLEWEEKETEYPNQYLSEPIKVPVFGDLHTDVFKILNKEKFDVVLIMGYYPLTSLMLLLYCRLKKISYIYSADTVDFENKSTRNDIKMYLIRKAATVWITGNASKSYMRKNNIPEEKIIKGAYTLDIGKLMKNYVNKRKDMKATKKQISIKENEKVVLFVGKLIPERKISLLLKSFCRLLEKHWDIKLIVIGDGPQSDIVKKFASENPDKIEYIEGVPYDELHIYYEAADCYVHPGTEPYSLAVAEAAIAGIPVIATKKVGAVYDYVKDGVNGYRITGNSVKEMTEYLEKTLYKTKWSGKKIGKLQEKFLKELSPEKVARNLIEKIEVML